MSWHRLLCTPGLVCGFFIGDLEWSNYDLTFQAIANSDEGFTALVHWTGAGDTIGISPGNPMLPDVLRRAASMNAFRARRSRIEPDRWHDVHITGARLQRARRRGWR